MKIKTLLAVIGLLLAFPAAYFISISILKHTFNQDYLFDASWPLLRQWGISEGFGLNINLLIVFGPVLAFVLNLLPVLQFDFHITKERFDCQVSILKHWINLTVVLFSGLILLTLVTYLLLENCH